MKANDMHQFNFYYGAFNRIYWVYRTEQRGDWWECINVPSELIVVTYYSEHAKVKDIKLLRDYIKEHGTHYNSLGVEIPKPLI